VRSALVKIPGVVDSDQTTVTAAKDSAVIKVKKGSVTAEQLVEVVAKVNDGQFKATLKK
jgi:hypothetical protein